MPQSTTGSRNHWEGVNVDYDQGPIEVGGQRYSGVMPAFGKRLSDTEVARLLTFLRTSLNDGGSPVSAEEIEQVRQGYADRNQAWTTEELQ